MRKLSPIVLLLLVLLAVWWLRQPPPLQVAPHVAMGGAPVTALPTTSLPAAAPTAAERDSLPAFLPPEARTTLGLIARGGPFPHRQDGSVFGNREQRLPAKPRGYYQEYTVETPGLDHRGARRIITGGQPPVMYYYTDDHYDSFRNFQVPK